MNGCSCKSKPRSSTLDSSSTTAVPATVTATATAITVTVAHNAREEDSFRCSICLDLAFKPIVQSCGHVFCFWCVHRAMNSKRESQCPVCRRRYLHFPRVCPLLHHFLAKAFPTQYQARALDTLDMENRYQVYSPYIPPVTRLNASLSSSPLKYQKTKDWPSSNLLPTTPSSPLYNTNHTFNDVIEYNLTEEPLTTANTNPNLNVCPKIDNHLHVYIEQIGGMAHVQKTSQLRSIVDDHFMPTNICDSELINTLVEANGYGACNLLSIEDFQCALCGNLLCKPTVLNCGQVFCQSCLGKPNTVTSSRKCPSCKCPHPGNSLHVCLELDHYLQATFPLQYQERIKEISTHERESENLKHEEVEINDGYVDEEYFDIVHEGIGCDGCGMFPIVGKHYHCKDCTEATGFDLCGKCKEKNTLCGRFNQQHAPHHEMEEVKTIANGGTMNARLRLSNQVSPLTLILHSNTILQRRQTQHSYHEEVLLNDFDDYVNLLV